MGRWNLFCPILQISQGNSKRANPSANVSLHSPSVDTESLSTFPTDDLFDRMIALSRLDLEEHQVSPLDILLGGPLDRRRPHLFRLPIRDRIELERPAPFRIPAFEEGLVG
jgi:hypothetical protein